MRITNGKSANSSSVLLVFLRRSNLLSQTKKARSLGTRLDGDGPSVSVKKVKKRWERVWKEYLEPSPYCFIVYLFIS